MTAPTSSAASTTRPGALAPDPSPPVLSADAPLVEGIAWNWVGRHGHDATALADILEEFVGYFNGRYAWTAEHLIPGCWARHGALVEEITTLMWSRWSGFESPDATPEAAQAWHTYYLPGFMARVNAWLGSAAAECRSGNHEASGIRSRTPTFSGRPSHRTLPNS
ncbi:MAG: hypothetical protein NVS3B18_14720 [Candidatus Dormibacteria bacterium]